MEARQRNRTQAFATGVMLALLAGAAAGWLARPLVSNARPKLEPPPARYANLKNPYSLTDEAALAEGEKIYNRYCWLCHGATGNGVGPGMADIVPPPTDFTDKDRVSRMNDGYWFWRVKEGFPEDLTRLMPAWGKVLTDDQIWKVITYEMTFAQKAESQRK